MKKYILLTLSFISPILATPEQLQVKYSDSIPYLTGYNYDKNQPMANAFDLT